MSESKTAVPQLSVWAFQPDADSPGLYLQCESRAQRAAVMRALGCPDPLLVPNDLKQAPMTRSNKEAVSRPARHKDDLLIRTSSCSYAMRLFPSMNVRMVRAGFVGITISAQGPEHVMHIAEANELISMINRAKHDGVSST